MEESKDLKAGMTTRYEIGGKTLVLKPVTLGKMKRAMDAFTMRPGETLDTFDMLEKHLTIVLDNGENPFATAEWIRENITFPLANQIVSDMRKVNGMEDFRKGAAEISPATERIERDLVETPTPSV